MINFSMMESGKITCKMVQELKYGQTIEEKENLSKIDTKENGKMAKDMVKK